MGEIVTTELIWSNEKIAEITSLVCQSFTLLTYEKGQNDDVEIPSDKYILNFLNVGRGGLVVPYSLFSLTLRGARNSGLGVVGRWGVVRPEDRPRIVYSDCSENKLRGKERTKFNQRFEDTARLACGVFRLLYEPFPRSLIFPQEEYATRVKQAKAMLVLV